MANSFAIIRTKKLTTMGQVAGSASHTLRTIPTSNADPRRSHLNKNSLGEVQAVLDGVKNRVSAIEDEGHRVQKNSVRAIEYLMTASPDSDIFKSESKTKQFFKSCFHFLQEQHGKENIVSFHIQYDETTPHAVAYVVPKTKKGNLAAREFLGTPKLLSKLQDKFADRMKKYGLVRGLKGSKAKHTEVKDFYRLIKQNQSDIGFLEREQKLKVLEAQAIEADLKISQYEVERVKHAGENRYLQTALEEKTKEETMIRKATIRLVKGAFSKSELSKMFGVEIVGKQDIFDALQKSGKADNLATAVALVSLEVKRFKPDWDSTVKFAVEMQEEPKPLAAQRPTHTTTTRKMKI